MPPDLANSLNLVAWEWAASKSTRCPWLPMHQMGFGLQLDSGDYLLVSQGDGKSLKRFGGPGEIRTHDLFHAMEARSQLRHRPAELSSSISYGEVQ